MDLFRNPPQGNQRSARQVEPIHSQTTGLSVHVRLLHRPLTSFADVSVFSTVLQPRSGGGGVRLVLFRDFWQFIKNNNKHAQRIVSGTESPVRLNFLRLEYN